MRFATVMLVIAAFGVPASAGLPSTPTAPVAPLAALASSAVSSDATVAEPAIRALRDRGAAGLATLLDANRADIQAVRRGDALPRNWEQVRTAIDRVAGQRDAYASGLFWYTDRNAALAAARATGKPVLSLRLLGRLDDELSCANSRFFRTVLYANSAVSARLRDGFILHWSSERPVPKITIDYGDGRSIETTITGNSAHYVLDSKGRVVDVIPGLYGPAAFLGELETISAQVKRVGDLGDSSWSLLQMAYWHDRAVAAEKKWDELMDRAGALPRAVAAPLPAPATARKTSARARRPAPEAQDKTEAPPEASDAGLLAITKSIVELPIVREIELDPTPDVGASYDRTVRSAIPYVYGECRLDAGSLALMARKAGPGANLDQLRLSFETAITSDTILNRFRIHPMVLGVLMQSPDGRFEAINRVIYDSVFQTPASDPWLGLKPDVYTALEAR